MSQINFPARHYKNVCDEVASTNKSMQLQSELQTLNAASANCATQACTFFD